MKNFRLEEIGPSWHDKLPQARISTRVPNMKNMQNIHIMFNNAEYAKYT
jgi:hypothetical protein